MPVTARLSKLFYERLGEEVTNELVDWFNAVDATYRADLRELNELNFARFDAKVEQRIATLEARLEGKMAALESRLDGKMVALESRLGGKMVALESSLEKKIENGLSALSAKLERRLAEQTKWLIMAWLSLLIAMASLWIRG